MNRTLKLKLQPKQVKTQKIRQSLGNVRFVWNKLLDIEKQHYKETGKFIFYYALCKEITKLRNTYPFLKETSVKSQQQIARKLSITLNAFIKQKNTGYGFPHYMSRNRRDGILIFPEGFKIKDNAIFIPKVGWIQFKDKITKKPLWQTIKQTATSVSIIQEPDGYYAIITYEREPQPLQQTDRTVGIDVGIKTTLSTSDGTEYALPTQEMRNIIAEIEHLQSIEATKKEINEKRGIKYSRRIKRIRTKRLKLYQKLDNIKRDFYHKTINDIVKSHDNIVVEDLDLKELKEHESDNEHRDRKIHKDISMIALGEFFRILEYKANQHGRTIIRVDPHHTSKRCSRCGYINHNLQLHHRTYKCPNCGYKADRDYNASLNILQKGLEVLQKPLSAGHVEYMREMASGGST